MDYFETGAPLAYFAETGDPRTGLKLGLLAAREMKEAQGQLAAAVPDAHQEVAATAERRLGEQYLARHQAALAGDESAQLDQLRAVFVAQRQQEQEILDALQVQPFEFLRERRADPGQRGQR
jgi:hypothetical protein